MQSCDLRKEFVKGHQKYEYRIDKKTWKKLRSITKTLYNNDSEFYRDLTDMVNNGILNKIEESQKKGIPKSFYRPSMNYILEPLKIWHKDCIMNTSIGNVVPIESNLLLYFSNESFNIEHPSFTKKDIKKINNLSKKISENLNEITEIFIEIGKRKAITVCVDVIENFGLDDALKEFFYICLITDFATKTNLHGYDFNRNEKNSKEKFRWFEPAASVYEIIISYAEQFIKKKYDLTESALQQLLRDSDNLRNLHSFIREIFRDFTNKHSSYTMIGESPYLFMSGKTPLFSDKQIAKFKSCRDLSNLDKLAKNIKNEDGLSPFETEIEFTKIEPLLSKKQKQTDIVYILSQVLQKNQVKTTEKRKKQLIFKGKPSFFDKMTFLDKYNTFGDFSPRDTPFINGYENVGKYIKFDKEKVYSDLIKWVELFSFS